MQVFISYAQADQKIAKELRSRLAEAGVKVWLADEEVLPGENLSLEVGKALQRSDAMVVLLSPDAVESKSVRSEITYAFSSPKFEGRLLPVVVKPTGGIPWFLKTFPMLHVEGAQNQSVKRLAQKIVESLAAPVKSGSTAERNVGASKAVG